MTTVDGSVDSRGRPAAVVTGIGMVTPLGRDVVDVFDALCTGKSGLRRPPDGHPAAGVLEVAGIVPDADPLEVMSPIEARLVDRYIVLALLAAADAIADAGLVVGRDVDPARVAVVVSTGGGGLETYENQAAARRQRSHEAISPYMLPGMLPNMAAARIAIKYGARGYSASIATACAAGAQSVAEALRLIRGGEADVVVCGGTDAPLHASVAAGFANSRALAARWADPTAASRPFDRRRNGFVLSEGAAVLVVERAGHADARRVAGYADVRGWGASTDAHHPTTPRADGEGAMASMRQAITDAGVDVSSVGYLNAHGTSTKLGDAAEAKAVNAVFNGSAPAVSSTKALSGHLLGGGGALEAAVTAMALARGLLPPTANLDDPDPACDLDHVRGGARVVRVPAAMSNSFAFGGHNVSLVLTPASTRLTRFSNSSNERDSNSG